MAALERQTPRNRPAELLAALCVVEADRQMSEEERLTLDELTRPITWRHRFVQWLARNLGVRLYAAPTILLVDLRDHPQDGDAPKVH